MTSINTLQASSALSIVAASASSDDSSQKTSSQQSAVTPQVQVSIPTAKSSAVGHAVLVGALSSQDQYADVMQRAIADGVNPKNIPSGSMEMLQEHLSDDPNLVMAFQSTSQFNAEMSQNRTQSSADLSAALYSGQGLEMLGAKPYQFSDLMDDLKTAAKGAGSVGQQAAESELETTVSGMEQAFATGTLTVQNAYEVSGLVTPGTDWHFTGPADGVPTGFEEGTGTINDPCDTPDADGQNHYVTGTSAGTLIYFSWPSADDQIPNKTTS